jgi:hypothetical protein
MSDTSKPIPADDEHVVCIYEFRAGAFVRSRVRFEIESAALDYDDVKVRILEDRRWVASEFRVHLSGPRGRVREFYDAIDEWVAEYER